jgi:glutathione S-transferase
MKIVIGDKNWSTWSMRPWLVLKRMGRPFEEVNIQLRRDDTAGQIAAHSPSGKVPVLIDETLSIWDSLAICEYLADRFPGAHLWPGDPTARALARSAAAEMHSGFPSVRGELPMDLKLETKADLTEATAMEIRRIVSLFSELRGRFGADGPFLVGVWSIADAFFTPVATRFRSYGVAPSDFGDAGAAGRYCETLLETAEFKAWEEGALAERD